MAGGLLLEAQLGEKLGVTDVDSSVPAELILFFNPHIYLSGYGSTTWQGVKAGIDDGSLGAQMPAGLFNFKKATATADEYQILAWYMAPKADHGGEIAKLAGNFVVEFSDEVATAKGYDIAMWNSAKKSAAYYKLVDGSYELVTG